MRDHDRGPVLAVTRPSHPGLVDHLDRGALIEPSIDNISTLRGVRPCLQVTLCLSCCKPPGWAGHTQACSTRPRACEELHSSACLHSGHAQDDSLSPMLFSRMDMGEGWSCWNTMPGWLCIAVTHPPGGSGPTPSVRDLARWVVLSGGDLMFLCRAWTSLESLDGPVMTGTSSHLSGCWGWSPRRGGHVVLARHP